MSSQTKWREEQVLVICPGSSTTMAQLGCSELTPPSQRFPTRMFKDTKTGEWRPHYTYKRKKKSATNLLGGVQNGDAGADNKDDDEYEVVEDPDSTEGAVYPMQSGRIVNMEAFLAFLDHVHGMLTTTYHNTPIVLMASPQWTRPDCEAIARYVFEKTKTPALSLIHSGIATQYGLRWPSMTVVDIGFEKVDVTCIYENRVVNHRDVGATTPDTAAAGAISGGEIFTRKLLQLLKEQKFDHEMAEQLKKSPICEVLPYAPDRPDLMELPTANAAGASQQQQQQQQQQKQQEGAIEAAPVAAPSTVPASEPAPAPSAADAAASGATTDEPVGAEGVDDANGDEKAGDNDGVLNIADIVTSGQTKEFLAKKEKEKMEKAKAGKKAKGQEAADASKPIRLPNSKRLKNVFHYEDIVPDLPSPSAPKPNVAAKEGEQKPAADGEEPKPEASAGGEEKPQEQQSSGDPLKIDNFLPPPEPSATSEPLNKKIRRDIEVGLERFTFADRAEIDRIATAIYEACQGIGEMYMRPACWDNLVFVGNGSRIRGLKENIVQTLTARHLISPSSATMFTSELPSNVATPSGTGSQTPTGSFTGPPHTMGAAPSSGVNPLLQAATTASLQQSAGGQVHPGMMTPGGAPGSASGDASAPHASHHFHSQTPTSIKMAGMPTYLAEWTKHGFEEAMFLGSLVAARMAFCVHNMDAQGLEAQRLMSLNRVDYNELGPKGIRTHSMLG